MMEQPTNSSGITAMPGYVCRLIMSIYCRRQAGEIWGMHVHIIIISWGFQQSNPDSKLCFFWQYDKLINLILVVDDMAFASNSRELINWVKCRLSAAFNLKLLVRIEAVNWPGIIKINTQLLHWSKKIHPKISNHSQSSSSKTRISTVIDKLWPVS